MSKAETEKDMPAEDKNQPRAIEQSTSAIEWVAAAAGAVLLACMIGYMAWLGASPKSGVPEIRITTEAPRPVAERFLVRFSARNSGDTASALVLKARLMRDGQEIESHEVTLDYLPRDSQQSGGFIFETNPQGLALEIAPTAYVEP